MDWLRGWRSIAVAVWCSVVALLAGCTTVASGPTRTLNAYSAALRRHDYDAAYALMSESYRAQHARDEFVRMMRENSREVAETAARLRSAQAEVHITAQISYGVGDTLRFVSERGKWRIAGNPADFYSQLTPRDALRSFLRAYRLRRWDVMLRFVPAKYRQRMNLAKMRQQFEAAGREEIESLMTTLEANVTEPITEKGAEARMPYGERYEVRFVRESGRWCIQDLD